MTVYHYFRQWRKNGAWERIHEQLRQWVRAVEDRHQASVRSYSRQSIGRNSNHDSSDAEAISLVCNFSDILLGHSQYIFSLAISPDGQTLVSGGEDETIKIWQVSTGKELRTLTGHSEAVYCLAISPDGKTLVSGSADRTIKIWRSH